MLSIILTALKNKWTYIISYFIVTLIIMSIMGSVIKCQRETIRDMKPKKVLRFRSN